MFKVNKMNTDNELIITNLHKIYIIFIVQNHLTIIAQKLYNKYNKKMFLALWWCE